MQQIPKVSLLTCLTGLWLASGACGLEPIVDFSGNGTLAVKNLSGTTTVAAVGGVDSAKVTYLPYKSRKGVYLSPGMTVIIPVDQFNPQEGTISFWFRPDWSPGDATMHEILFINAPPAYTLNFSKGWYTDRQGCYIFADPAGSTYFGVHNLFTGRTWRHYALRWSAKLGRMQVVVDGDTSVWGQRVGQFKTDVSGPLRATVTLDGTACGAYAEVRVFDRYLSAPEIVQTAGLRTVARYLQEQAPPPGGENHASGTADIAFVDPLTGETVKVSGVRERDDLTALPDAASSQGVVYNPDKMKTLPVTPHTKWARPLAGGRLRLLMVMPVGFHNEYSMLREGVELWQRLDCECDMTDQLTSGISNNEYDVILVTFMGWGGWYWKGWSDLDQKLRSWIVERVKNGKSGLVYCYPQRLNDELAGVFQPNTRIPSDILLRGFPVPLMHRVDMVSDRKKWYEKCYELDDTFFEDPANLSTNIIEVYGTESVRAVRLNYVNGSWEPNMGFTPDTVLNAAATDVHYDYWQALLARAVLFAARKEPVTAIRSVDLAGENWIVTADNAPAKARLWYRARDVWGRIYAQGEVPLRGARTPIAGKPLPPRTAVDVIVRDAQGRVLDWYIACTPPATTVKITAIALDKEAYRKGDTISGKATVAADRPGYFSLETYLADHEGRRIVGRRIPCSLNRGNTVLPFTLAIPKSSDTLLMRIDVLLTQGGRFIDQRSADCPVPEDRFEGFYAQIYGGGGNRLFARHGAERFRDEFGGTGAMHRGDHTYNTAARENRRSIEYTTDLGLVMDDKSLAAFMEDWNTFFPGNLVCDLNESRNYRPVFYSLGEEHFFINHSNADPKVAALFREYLKDKYGGDLAKLNEIWGTNYSSWDAVKMQPPEITDMLKFKPDAVKFETSRFSEKLFADKHACLADYIRKVDPLADVGIHTSWDTWMGRAYDFWLLSKAMDAMMCYGGTQNQYARSFFKRYYGCNYHYSIGCQEEARWYPWLLLTSGAHGLSWYTLNPQIWGATTADMNLSSDWAASCSEFAAVKNLGDLLTRTDYVQDQVAIHYSSDSLWCGSLDLSWIHNCFVNLFFDAGVPFRFVSYQQLGEGELLKRKYPLFVMAHSISLSAQEVKAIREYLEQGGVVWADTMPGEYDNFGRKLKESQLADVFTGLKEVVLPGGKTLKIGQCGRGMVVLGDIGNYAYDRNVGNHIPTQNLLDRVVELAKVNRVAKVVDRKTGAMANGIWTAGYRQGRQLYVLTTRDYQLADPTKAPVEIEFGRKGHIYDIRAGKYCGLADKIATELQPTYGKVYSVLPYRVRTIQAETIGKVKRGEDLVLSVKLVADGRIATTETHYLRVSMTGPNGQEVKSLRRFAGISAGKGEIRLPIAYDDAPGNWTVTLKDSATGLVARVRYSLAMKESR